MLNLMIVGDTETGKASLMKKLIKKQKLSKDEISICNWKLTSRGGIIYFRTWNFPSQVCNIVLHIIIRKFSRDKIFKDPLF